MKKKSYMSNPLEHMPGGVFIYRCKDEQILYANSKLLEMLECESFEELLEYSGGTFAGVLHPDDRKAMMESIAAQIEYNEDKLDHIEYRAVTKTGRILHLEDYGKKVTDETEGDIFYVFVADMERKLLSYDIDALTNLPGQQQFKNYALKFQSECVKSQKRPVYIYFDLSNFKAFTRSYGEDKADNVLKEVARILQTEFSDSFVAHEAADHFIVLTGDELILERTQKVIDRIDSLERRANVYGRAGICYPDALTSAPSDSVKLAREACTTIPKDAADHIQIYSGAHTKSQRVSEYAVNHIDEAIEAGEISVYYQPMIRTSNHGLCGFEALARWNSREFGFLAPFDFVPALEKSAQIDKLDRQMIREICRQYRRTVNGGIIPVPISFNLSLQDFTKGDIVHFVINTADEFQVPHSMLRVELGESVFLSDDNRVRNAIDAFRRAGFQVWMDNFGRSSSSLASLENVRIDKLKLDMDVMAPLNEKNREIISAIIASARHLGIHTLAKGVENVQQMDFLKSIGCEEVQGYFFGRPLELAESMTAFEEQENKMANTGYSANQYEAIEAGAISAGSPYAILEDDGARFHYVFLGREFTQLLESAGGMSAEETLVRFNDPAGQYSSIFREKLNQAEAHEGFIHFAFPYYSELLTFTVHVLSHRENKRLFKLILSYNAEASSGEDVREKQKTDIIENYDALIRSLSE